MIGVFPCPLPFMLTVPVLPNSERISLSATCCCALGNISTILVSEGKRVWKFQAETGSKGARVEVTVTADPKTSIDRTAKHSERARRGTVARAMVATSQWV